MDASEIERSMEVLERVGSGGEAQSQHLMIHALLLVVIELRVLNYTLAEIAKNEQAGETKKIKETTRIGNGIGGDR